MNLPDLPPASLLERTISHNGALVATVLRVESHGRNVKVVYDNANWVIVPPSVCSADLLGRTPEAEAYREMVRAFGLGFHPDNDPADYTSYPDGYDAARTLAVLNAAWTLGVDVYAEAGPIFDALLGR